MKTKCCHTRHIQVVDKKNICFNPQCENYLGQVTCYREFTKLRNSITISVFIFSMLFTFNDFSNANKNYIDVTADMTVPPTPLNVENLKKEIENNEIICAHEVFAQMMLESGNLSSFLLKKSNNMLGMRYPAKRNTTACGIYLPAQDTIIMGTQEELRKLAAQNNYAVYASWQDAVADYKLWQESAFKMKDRYLEFLGKVYAQDTLYVTKIRKMAASDLALAEVE
jgi:uncharacterized FlgJ-related protein